MVIRFFVCMWVVSSDWCVLWNVVLVMVSVVCLCRLWVKFLGLSLSRCCWELGVGLVVRLIFGSLVIGLMMLGWVLCGLLMVMLIS